MSSDYKKQVKEILSELQGVGWSVSYNSNHYKVYPPQGGCTPVIIAASPSDWRALKNIKSHIRHRGYVLSCI